jgi:quercetin dioxygenase-like cupin family protein
MIIARGRASGLPSERRGATFTGEVWADTIVPGSHGVTVASIFFTPGARTFWHRHERGQILQVIGGTGFVCAAGGPPEPIRPGDIVWVPAGERHWHGAAPDSFMIHIATSLGTTEWAEEVDEAHYLAAQLEQGTDRQ